MRPVGLPEHQIQQNLHNQLYQIQHPQLEMTSMVIPYRDTDQKIEPPNYIRWSLPQLCVASALAMILYGITSIGDGWIFSPTVGYHALGMTIAGVVCTQQRVLCVTPYVKPSTSTVIYYGTKIIGITCGVSGMVVIFYLSGLNFTSFHACSGIAFFGSWLLQIMSRMIGWTRCATCLEHITYGIGICSTLMGLQYGTFKNNLLIHNNTSIIPSNSTVSFINSTVNTVNTNSWSSWLSQTSVTSIVLLASGITTFIAMSYS
jgi:hypothetical protein